MAADALASRTAPVNPALEEGIARLRAAVRHRPGDIRLRLQFGGALFQMGRLAEAAQAYREAIAQHPDSAEAWCNLAAVLVGLDQPEDALEAADRALALAPDQVEALLNRGDAARQLGRMREAVDAYSRAVELRPDSPSALNKLAGAIRTGGEEEAAGKLLEHALALAPQYGLALVNLGTLRAAQRRLEEARELLGRALAQRGLEARARRDAEGTLSRIEEHTRTDGALARSLEAGSPLPLEQALRSAASGSDDVDEEMLELLAALAAGLAADRSFETAFAKLEALPAEWPRLEALFSRHAGEAPRGVEEGLQAFEAAAREPLSPEWLELSAYERAVRLRGESWPRSDADGPAWEAWIRYWHAVLSAAWPECLPGHFKLVSNRVGVELRVRRVPPRRTAGTMRRVFTQVLPAAPPGPGRAALAYFSLGHLHPFSDGNGRVARWLLNGELVRGGFGPLLLGGGYGQSLPAAYSGVLHLRDLGPMLDLFARAGRFTEALLKGRVATPGAPG